VKTGTHSQGERLIQHNSLIICVHLRFYFPLEIDFLQTATGTPKLRDYRFRLASGHGIGFLPACMSSLPTADLLALDTDGLKSRLSKLRRYL
jgi:hypothetical protein